MAREVAVIDCDGHLVESVAELAEYMDPSIRPVALAPLRNRQGVFPSLDGFHYPTSERQENETEAKVRASSHRAGSGEDVLAFLEQAEIEHTVLYPSEGLAVGNIGVPEYAVRLCRAYNDYVADRFRRLSPRIHPAALIPMQDPKDAVSELRRAVKELDLAGAMLPSTGLPLHLAHEYYWPVYEEAARLGCPLGVHGGANRDICHLDTFSNRLGARLLWHPMPLMVALVGFIYHGLFDRLPDLRVSFLEGGAAWTVPVFERMERDSEFFAGAKRKLPDYLASGQILVGCEGNDDTLPYLANRVGIEAFAYSSDYPHEVDLPGAKRMIAETLANPELSREEQAAVLGGNARRFFGL